ncbi:MAG: hypothetical protein U0237_05020 [Thermoleophilia bacterium]
MTDPLPHLPADGSDDFPAQLAVLLETAHTLWGQPDERRRMRYFGFRPAVEQGVLKREWHGMQVRVSSNTLRAALPGAGELVYRGGDRTVLLDGGPFAPTEGGLELVRQLMDLIQSYERWVESREGREERIARGRPDRPRRAPPERPGRDAPHAAPPQVQRPRR